MYWKSLYKIMWQFESCNFFTLLPEKLEFFEFSKEKQGQTVWTVKHHKGKEHLPIVKRDICDLLLHDFDRF